MLPGEDPGQAEIFGRAGDKDHFVSGNPQAGQDGADRAESRGAGCLRDRTGVYGSDGSDG